ncbi:MAG: T9SS type A sorting domain-containing protein [Flavobacteriaceae bacterium]
MYPNPGKIFSIKIDNNINNIDLTVTDMTGKLVLKKELTATDNKVNMSHFVNGIYLFNLVNGNALISKKVIVK